LKDGGISLFRVHDRGHHCTGFPAEALPRKNVRMIPVRKQQVCGPAGNPSGSVKTARVPLWKAEYPPDGKTFRVQFPGYSQAEPGSRKSFDFYMGAGFVLSGEFDRFSTGQGLSPGRSTSLFRLVYPIWSIPTAYPD
jgi:hypothetical protein